MAQISTTARKMRTGMWMASAFQKGEKGKQKIIALGKGPSSAVARKNAKAAAKGVTSDGRLRKGYRVIGGTVVRVGKR